MCYVDLCKAATYVPPVEESVLRHIAADIDDDLQEKVWDLLRHNNTTTSEQAAAAASSLGYTINQQTLVTDYLLARLRLDPKETLRNLVPSCLGENVPIIFKAALVKACLAITRDTNRLPWNPSISSMYSSLCTPLRKLFVQTLNAELGGGASKDINNGGPTVVKKTSMAGGYDGLSATTSSRMTSTTMTTTAARKDNYYSSGQQTELLQDMLKLFKADPLLALLGNDSDSVEDNAAIMTGMANLFQHPDHGIRQLASECLAKLHQSVNIQQWGPNKLRMMVNFWRISSQVVFVLAKQILDNKQGEEGLRSLLNLLMKLLSARNDFLSHHQVRGGLSRMEKERIANLNNDDRTRRRRGQMYVSAFRRQWPWKLQFWCHYAGLIRTCARTRSGVLDTCARRRDLRTRKRMCSSTTRLR